jgi:sulfite exporter TauE/SafE
MSPAIDYFSLVLLGLAGTGHCLGMCGPLVIALPGQYGRWQAHAIYHAGRLITYTAVGTALGGAGQGLVHLWGLSSEETMIWAARIQIGFSLPVALFLLVLGLNRLGLGSEPQWLSTAIPRLIPGYSAVMKHVLRGQSHRWLFVMGLMLGLLPCGLSYGVFARALAAGGAAQGALMAALFGFGTLPGLLLLATGAAAVWQRYRTQMEMMAGLIMIGMAFSLLLDIWTAIF